MCCFYTLCTKKNDGRFVPFYLIRHYLKMINQAWHYSPPDCYDYFRTRLVSQCHLSQFPVSFVPHKVGVPLTNYGSIGWNFLRLFSTDCFDPIAPSSARPSDQISHWQSKIITDRRTKVWHVSLPPITSDYYFPLMQFLPLPDFPSDFPPDPPILLSVGQWDAGFKKILLLNAEP